MRDLQGSERIIITARRAVNHEHRRPLPDLGIFDRTARRLYNGAVLEKLAFDLRSQLLNRMMMIMKVAP